MWQKRQFNVHPTWLDTQSVRTGPQHGPRGYDAAKKIKGRKRHALVDTDGRPLLVEPHTADVQDRDGGGALLQISRGLFPFIEKVYPQAAYVLLTRHPFAIFSSFAESFFDDDSAHRDCDLWVVYWSGHGYASNGSWV